MPIKRLLVILLLAGCAGRAPGMATTLHDMRLALSQSEVASMFVAFAAGCRGIPFVLHRTGQVKVIAAVTAPGEVLPVRDSVAPSGAETEVGPSHVEVLLERAPGAEAVATAHPEICKEIEDRPTRYTLGPGGFQAQGPDGRWYLTNVRNVQKVVALLAAAALPPK